MWKQQAKIIATMLADQGSYHRCPMMAGGEDVEFKSHSYEDESIISGAGVCRLTKVEHQPNVDSLDFDCGDRLRISVNPILSDRIVIKFGKKQ